jgi:ribose transport system permease protein
MDEHVEIRKKGFIDSIAIFMKKNVILLFLILVIIVVTSIEKSFFTYQNIINVTRQISIGGIMAFGIAFVLISGAIDLSVGAVYTFSSCVLASTITTLGVWPAILLSVASAIILSGLNGVLLSIVGNDSGSPFIVTFGMKTVVYSLALILTKGLHIIVESTPVLDFFGKGSAGPIPVPIIVLLVVAVLSFFILHKTPFGRRLYFLGGNVETARLSGINIAKHKIIAFALLGLCISIASVISISRVGSASPTMGNTFDFDVITMAVVGGVMLGGGKGSMYNVAVGIFVIGILSNAMNLLNIPINLQLAIKGCLIVLAVWFDTFSKRMDVEG